MTKEQVIAIISEMDWPEEWYNKTEAQINIEAALAKYVVYQEDPDTHRVYHRQYHLTKEDAEKDLDSRRCNDGRWCYCTIAEICEPGSGGYRKRYQIGWDGRF